MTPFLRIPRKLALWVISILTAAASLASYSESYHALYLWAVNHSVGGNWGYYWPVQIDTFIAMGEIALFVGLVDQWQTRKRIFPWVVIFIGLAVSVAANVGHVQTTDWLSRGTAAVPPVAAWASLVVGMGVLKRVVDLYARHTSGTGEEPVPEQPPMTVSGTVTGRIPAPVETVTETPKKVRTPKPSKAAATSAPRRPIQEVLDDAVAKFGDAEELPGHREIREQLGVGAGRADQVRAHLAELVAERDAEPEPAPAVSEAALDPDATVQFNAIGHPAPGQQVSSYQQLPVTPLGGSPTRV